MKIFGCPDGIWVKLKDPKVNFDKILSGLYSKWKETFCWVYCPLLVDRVKIVGKRVTQLRPPANSELSPKVNSLCRASLIDVQVEAR